MHETPDRNSDRTACANCGAPLDGPFCSQCGQETRHGIVPFRQLAVDFLGDVFTFDARFFRTLVPLVLKPGYLTREYFAGRRVRYVPPLRLFVFTSFVFFLLLGLYTTGIDVPEQDTSEGFDPVTYEEDTLNLPDDVDRQLRARIDTLARQSALSARIEHAFLIGTQRTLRDPDQFVQRLIGRLSGLAFVLLPLFAAFLKALYIRQDWFYTHHLVFALHAHAFFFITCILLLILHVVLGETGSGWINLLFFGSNGLYLLVASHRVYQQRFGKTLLKFLILLWGYLTLMVLAVAVLTAVTVTLF